MAKAKKNTLLDDALVAALSEPYAIRWTDRVSQDVLEELKELRERWQAGDVHLSASGLHRIVQRKVPVGLTAFKEWLKSHDEEKQDPA